MNEHYLFPLYLFGSMLLAIFAISLTVFLVVQKQRQARYKMEKQRLEYRYQNELLQTRLDVQEQSMTLISEEIHDNIGQLMSLTHMYLSSMVDLIADQRGKELMVRSRNLVSTAIRELRHISHSLNSDLIREVGLVSFLERDLDFISDSSELDCSFEVTGTPYSFTREQDLLIYRMVQETIQNVIKHAQASHLNISLNYKPEELNIQIRDDGIGFDTTAAWNAESLGLRNIRNRAQLLKAEMTLQSEPGKGSSLQLIIPPILSNEQTVD